MADFLKGLLSAEVGLKCLILIVILITPISRVLFIFGIPKAWEHRVKWMQLAHQQAHSLRIWPPVFLWGRRRGDSSLKAQHGLPLPKLNFLLPHRKSFGLPLKGSHYVHLLLPATHQKRLYAPGARGTQVTPLASQRQDAEPEAGRREMGSAKGKASPCYRHPRSALPSPGHGDQDRPSGLQQLRQPGLGQLCPGAESREQSAAAR